MSLHEVPYPLLSVLLEEQPRRFDVRRILELRDSYVVDLLHNYVGRG